ncbi:DUF6624 domain-containing protein [Cochleicola gelatinilyticus]|uniref:DUF6624 domain-containing protein n=1 Tax=Cochleicola gelatinilyticus TaxID=1763537 RepID=UPI000AB3B7CE|nr:DUF6624 domain-containing protein [Cochleicola gelatinilyticus]
MEAVHLQNAKQLNEIIKTIGFPTIEAVGKEANEAAWLIIQHAISDPAFMKKCLKLLEQAVNENKANPIHLAYLSDRIAVLEGNPQQYGTQFDWDKNYQLSPNKYDDLLKVNERRKSLGLNSLETQTLQIRERALHENQSPPKDLHKRNAERNTWLKRVGWLK